MVLFCAFFFSKWQLIIFLRGGPFGQSPDAYIKMMLESHGPSPANHQTELPCTNTNLHEFPWEVRGLVLLHSCNRAPAQNKNPLLPPGTHHHIVNDVSTTLRGNKYGFCCSWRINAPQFKVKKLEEKEWCEMLAQNLNLSFAIRLLWKSGVTCACRKVWGGREVYSPSFPVRLQKNATPETLCSSLYQGRGVIPMGGGIKYL